MATLGCLLILVLGLARPSSAFPPSITIGALFTEHELEERLVFHAAIDHINAGYNHQVLQPRVEIVKADDSFDANNKVCHLLHQAPVAIFGPFSDISAMQVQSICENFEVPHIVARLVSDLGPRTDLSINLYPHLSILAKVFMSLVDSWEWTEFVVIYEESSNIVHFTDYFSKINDKSWTVRIFQLLPDRPYRDILWQVKATGIVNIVWDIRTEHIVEVMRQAQQVGIMTEQHFYLMTCMDLHTLELDDYRHSGTNITSLRIVQEEHPYLRTMIGQWDSLVRQHLPRQVVARPRHLKSHSAMIFDGVMILHEALEELNQFSPVAMSCQEGDSWQYGTTVINYIRQKTDKGITGYIGFDSSGFRANLTFDILSTTDSEFELVGQWGEGGIRKTDNWKKHSVSVDELPLIRITTLVNDPFVMNTKSSKELKGNDRYEGYVVDLMKEIAKLLSIRFEINLVKDGNYGALVNKDTNEWNGMIGEVMRNEADIAIADLTINSNREQAVDFTYPFMSTGISIIYKKPTTKETSLWAFLSPFSTLVWIYLLGAFAFVSLILFYVGRFTPYEWSNPHPCVHHEPVLENACNMRNSFWCTIGSLMQQGSDVAPKALSTRVISAIWYFFTLIIVSSYTANLAAFLTVEISSFPFNSAEQLAQQNKIKYGCLKNGATHKFFANSGIKLYQKMAATMESDPQVFTTSNAMGRDRVEKENGKYAFFMESATIEFITERYCNLTQVGNLLDSKGYGVATRKGSKIRAPLSEAILKLQETGVLQQLKDRWWKHKGGGQCTSKPSTPLTELGLRNLGGVFVVLLVGSIFALLLGLCEFLVKTRMSSLDSSTFKEDLWQEFKFVMSCHKSTKVLKRKSVKSLSRSRMVSPASNNGTLATELPMSSLNRSTDYM